MSYLSKFRERINTLKNKTDNKDALDLLESIFVYVKDACDRINSGSRGYAESDLIEPIIPKVGVYGIKEGVQVVIQFTGEMSIDLVEGKHKFAIRMEHSGNIYDKAMTLDHFKQTIEHITTTYANGVEMSRRNNANPN